MNEEFLLPLPWGRNKNYWDKFRVSLLWNMSASEKRFESHLLRQMTLFLLIFLDFWTPMITELPPDRPNRSRSPGTRLNALDSQLLAISGPFWGWA
jgi:hypothetical protein